MVRQCLHKTWFCILRTVYWQGGHREVLNKHTKGIVSTAMRRDGNRQLFMHLDSLLPTNCCLSVSNHKRNSAACTSAYKNSDGLNTYQIAYAVDAGESHSHC